MAYDVMIASAIADKAKAELIAKRLRALKFRVRHDAKREHTTPTTRDLNDANRALTVLVLWSKAACDTTTADSDWVHAIAHLARSRKNVLVQAGLDTTTPDEPFDKDDRFSLSGMGPKRIPGGFYGLIDVLGQRFKRPGLSDYLRLAPTDAAGRDAWKKAHPKDPITGPAKKAAASKKKTAAKTATKKAPAKAAPAAAAATSAAAPAAAAPPPPPPAAPSAETLVPKIKLNPPMSPSAMPYRKPDPVLLRKPEKHEDIGWIILGPVLGGIAVMMLMAYFVRSTPSGALPSASMPAIGNATLPAACPPGEVPASLIEIPPLRTGTIIDDTEEAPEE